MREVELPARVLFAFRCHGNLKVAEKRQQPITHSESLQFKSLFVAKIIVHITFMHEGGYAEQVV